MEVLWCCWCCCASGGVLALDAVVKGNPKLIRVIMEEPALTVIFSMVKRKNIISISMTRNKLELLMKMRCMTRRSVCDLFFHSVLLVSIGGNTIVGVTYARVAS